MRLPSQNVKRGLQFNITPLIDVVFLLIIFFLVASHFIRNENLDQVALPLASQGRDEEESKSRVIVTVMPDHRLTIAGGEVSADDIERRIQLLSAEHGPAATELRIRCDRDVPYAVVEPLLQGAARNGVTRVRFAVMPK